jgi:hypothetical protein
LWPDDEQPVIHNRRVRVQIQERGEITPYGGLALAHDLAMRLGIDRDINASMQLLRLYLPYFDSDHLLTHVYNQYVGGTCIEDIAHLQHSDAIKHLTGACRIPDPSTAGDFLRRFDRSNLRAFQQVIDRAREKVWRQMPNSRKSVATVDMDSTIKCVYGECKQGPTSPIPASGPPSALLTLAETANRCGRSMFRQHGRRRRGRCRPGSPAHGPAALRQGLRPGDSAFYQKAIIAECVRRHVGFALVMDSYANLVEMAENLPESAWEPFSPTPPRRSSNQSSAESSAKTRAVRVRKARERNYKTLSTIEQWAGSSTTPSRAA